MNEECDCGRDHESLEWITEFVFLIEANRQKAGMTASTNGDFGKAVARVAHNAGWIRSDDLDAIRKELADLQAFVASFDELQDVPVQTKADYDFSQIQDYVHDEKEDQ